MVEFRVQRRGLERRWVILRVAPGHEPIEIGRSYDDPVQANEEASKLNELAKTVGEHRKPSPD